MAFFGCWLHHFLWLVPSQGPFYFTIVWPCNSTEAEKAQTLLTKASRDAALVNAGIISPEEARGALIADKESGYGDISAEAPETGDLAQLEGLLGQEEGQEPQLGQDKATDEFDPNQKRDESGQWTAEGGNSSPSKKEDGPSENLGESNKTQAKKLKLEIPTNSNPVSK